MRDLDVVPVEEVVDRQLPIALRPVLAHAVQELDLAPGGHQVDAEAAHPAEVLLERRRRWIEGRENEAAVARHLGGGCEPPSLAIQVAAVEDVLAAHADQRAVEVVTPAVVGADEARGVAEFRPADAVAPMRTGIQQDVDAAVAPAHNNHFVLADPVREEVARLGELGLVAHEVPSPGEDALEFQFVHVLVGEGGAVEQAGLGVVEIHFRSPCHAASRRAPENAKLSPYWFSKVPCIRSPWTVATASTGPRMSRRKKSLSPASAGASS